MARRKNRKPQQGKKYPGVHGKILDFIEHKVDEGNFYLHIRFMDKTEVSFVLGAKLVLKEADLSDISTGDYMLIREYKAYEE